MCLPRTDPAALLGVVCDPAYPTLPPCARTQVPYHTPYVHSHHSAYTHTQHNNLPLTTPQYPHTKSKLSVLPDL